MWVEEVPPLLTSNKCQRDNAAEAVRWSLGALGREPRLAQRRVILFFWPTRASSANQTSMAPRSTPTSRPISSRRAGKFLRNPHVGESSFCRT
jgi:hypothetical protein